MKLNAAFRYQLFDHKTSVMVYYIVIIALSILIGAGLFFFTSADGINMPEPSAHVEPMSFVGATVVFLFISGLCGFKENFMFALQSGVSRKTLFLSRLIAFAALAAFMMIADYILGSVLGLVLAAVSGMSMSVVFNSSIASLFLAMCYSFVMLTLGYCISILFFRLNKTGKILVGAGVPVFCFILLPMFDGYVTGGVIMRAIANFCGALMRAIFAHTVWSYLILLAGAAVLALLSWLMMRRAAIKK